MTTNEVFRMAREAGMAGMLSDVVTTFDELGRFAALARAAEREAIAQLVEQMGIDGYGTLAIAVAIRARGE